MRNSWTSGLSVVLLLNVLVACGSAPAGSVQPNQAEQQAKPNKTVTETTPGMRYSDKLNLQLHREETEHFVLSSMYGPYGVYTNYQESGESDAAASGHEVLSESAGLLMRYDVLMDRKDAFQAEWDLAKQVFELSSSFSYRYSPKQDKKYTINAAVDDLRMIRALYDAGERFKSPVYTELADTYGKRLYNFNIKNGKLYDFYDDTYKVTNNFVTLCYIDLATLKRLPLPSKEQEALISNMQEIVQQGYLSDTFPFYETRYDYATGTYQSEGINTVESLLTILSLAEAGVQQPASIAYLKDQVKGGTLYGKYDKKGKPQNQIQSTAIYAIAALIGSALEDADLYGDSIKQMEKYRVVDKDSPLFGGYGDTASNQAYSFDNLMALLAYAH